MLKLSKHLCHATEEYTDKMKTLVLTMFLKVVGMSIRSVQLKY